MAKRAGRKAAQKRLGTTRVELRKSGKYYTARFTDNAGKRLEIGLDKTSNKDAATTKAIAITEALDAQKPWEVAIGRTQVGSLKFTTVVDEWLEKACRWSDNTRRGHRSIIKQLKAEFGDRMVTEITSREIRGYLARRKAEGMPPASQNRILAALKMVFRVAVEWGYVSEDANPTVVVKMQHEDIKIKDVLDDDEYERLLAELPEPARRAVLVAGETGMRRGELERLTWEDVDFVARGVGELRIMLAKNHQFRVIPLTDERLRSLLLQMKAEATPHPKAPVFPKVVDNRVIKAAIRRLGISKYITLHNFRHQFCTTSLEVGMSSFFLQSIGGWKSPVMLERYGRRRSPAVHGEMAKRNRGRIPTTQTDEIEAARG